MFNQNFGASKSHNLHKLNVSCNLRKMKKKDNIRTSFTTASAHSTENQQWTKYKTNGGHGFSAEDANALTDILKGKKVEKIGLFNEKNGADRVVNGQLIQTKYYNSAKGSVESSFDISTGKYKYSNQKLEVPSDQYDKALEIMSEKIKEGKVEGYKNPSDSKKIIKKGSVSYKQARNIAKAGNIDSILFDIKSQCIISAYAFGISFGIQYANCKWNGMSNIEAFKISSASALKSGGFVLASGVLTQQFLRTTVGRSFAAFSTTISRRAVNTIYQTGVGKNFIHKTTSALLGKSISGAAAKSSATKLLRTNAVTAVVTTTIITIPDFYKAMFSDKISWNQFSKNLAVNIGGVGGGIGGAIGGATIGTPGGPIGVTVGGIIGGILGGLGISVGVKKIADLISDDDSKKMFEIIKNSIAQLAFDYMISETEFDKIEIQNVIKKIVTQKWLQNMYKAGVKNTKGSFNFASQQFEKFFKEEVEKREKIKLPNENVALEFLKNYS